jgi:MYXO-CTERM domain-containing protein
MSASRIAMAFAPRVISHFSVALLYNGQVLIGSYTLETGGDNTVPGAAWSGPGSVTNLSLPIESAGGAWRVSGNPFGDGVATRLVFSTLASGDCQSQCSNQSDCVLSSVYAVPEPGSCALALLGLGAAAFTPRRRRPPN